MVNAPTRATMRSPFTGHPSVRRPDAKDRIGVDISAGILPSVTLISTWTSGLPELMDALHAVFGATIPERTGLTLKTELGLLCRTGPQEWMLIGDDSTDRCAMLRATVTADVGSVTDISHARCRIQIHGVQCRAVLNKLFALDLRESSFPIGEVALTGTHHVPCMLHRLDTDTFAMVVFSTYAYDQLATVLDAAQEYGVNLQIG